MKTIKAKVHMLPTEDATQIVRKNEDGLLNNLGRTTKTSLNEWTNQHLYITTDDEIKEGDWVIQQFEGQDADVCQITNGEYEIAPDIQRKIIATTDPKLKLGVKPDGEVDDIGLPTYQSAKLPQIPQSFIEEYCKACGIDEVLVEYDEKYSTLPNSFIIIHPVEEKKVSEIELKILAAKLIQLPFEEKMIITDSIEAWDKWIEENL